MVSPTDLAARRKSGAYPLLYLLVISTGAIVFWVALTTRTDVHPDEVMHADAICYFETHWWPPPLNANSLYYSADGWSRVYNGELVYTVYGQIAGRIRPLLEAIQPPPMEVVLEGDYRVWFPLTFAARCPPNPSTFQFYRLLNAALWVITLTGLLLVGRRQRVVAGLALLLCSIPQVVYLYGYSNSDAWALSAACLLFVFALTRTSASGVCPRDLVGFGLLTGLVLLAKQSFWLAIPFSLLVWPARPELFTQRPLAAAARQAAVWLATIACVAFLVILPLKGVYPLSQPDYERQVVEMREIRARSDFRPSSPLFTGYHLAERGAPPTHVLTKAWFKDSLGSFYGVFAAMWLWLPTWVYALAGALLLAGMAVTALDLGLRRREYTLHQKLLLSAAPGFMLLSVMTSLYFSWTVDYQPQGRYLFAALLPLTLWVGGVSNSEPKRLLWIRAAIWLALLALSHYILVTRLVISPALR